MTGWDDLHQVDREPADDDAERRRDDWLDEREALEQERRDRLEERGGTFVREGLIEAGCEARAFAGETRLEAFVCRDPEGQWIADQEERFRQEES